MNDSLEFTAREKRIISLYKDPKRFVRLNAGRVLTFLILSFGLAAYSIFTSDWRFIYCGYGVLFFFALIQFVRVIREMPMLAVIIQKYEARLQDKTNAA